jgi:hypothetical protein
MGSRRKSILPDCQVGTGWDIKLALTIDTGLQSYYWERSTCIASFDGGSLESVHFMATGLLDSIMAFWTGGTAVRRGKLVDCEAKEQ